MNSINKSVSDWILNFLSKPSITFNNLPPCPYAKKAWLDNKVTVEEIKKPVAVNLYKKMNEYAVSWPGKDVVVFAFDYQTLSPEGLTQVVDHVQEEILDKHGLVALEDHPEDIEQIDDVVLNHGSLGLVLVQEKQKLTEAREWLEKKDYYKNWPDEYKQEVQAR